MVGFEQCSLSNCNRSGQTLVNENKLFCNECFDRIYKKQIQEIEILQIASFIRIYDFFNKIKK